MIYPCFAAALVFIKGSGEYGATYGDDTVAAFVTALT